MLLDRPCRFQTMQYVEKFLNKLYRHVLRHDLLPRGCKIVAAVSGGADSLAMLHALCRLDSLQKMGWGITVGHLNHQLRGQDADLDQQLVLDQTRQLGLDSVAESRDVSAISLQRGGSTELVARQERYDFLEKLAGRIGATRIALAHHGDDQVETVILNMIRGSSFRGLAGMPCKRSSAAEGVYIVRPMLSFRRSDLQKFLRQLSVDWREDRTNLQLTARRNVIRRQVLPLIRGVNPAADRSILHLARYARWVNNYLDRQVAPIVRELEASHGVLKLDCRQLLSREPLLQSQLIWHAARIAGARLGKVNSRHIDRLLKLAAQNKPIGQVMLPGKLLVQKRYGQLIFTAGLPSGKARQILEPVELPLPGKLQIKRQNLVISASLEKFDQETFQQFLAQKTSFAEMIDAGQLTGPLLVRSWHGGDKFHPLGAPGAKKVSDFFTDAKTPPEQRTQALVVCDQRGIVWLVGFRIDQRVRITRRTHRTVVLETSSPIGQPAQEH